MRKIHIYIYIYISHIYIFKFHKLMILIKISIIVSSKRGPGGTQRDIFSDFRLYRLAWEKQLAALKAEISN